MAKKQDQKPKKVQALVTRPPAPPPPVTILHGGLTYASTLKTLLAGPGTLDITSMVDGRSAWGPEGRYSTRDVQALVIAAIGKGASLPASLTAFEGEMGGNWPSVHTVYSWRRKFPDFGRAYKDAQAARGEILAEAALEVAMATDPDNVLADTLKVKTLNGMAGKINPETFGDKSVVEHQHTLKELGDDEIESRLRELAKDPDLQGVLDVEILENDPGNP